MAAVPQERDGKAGRHSGWNDAWLLLS